MKVCLHTLLGLFTLSFSVLLRADTMGLVKNVPAFPGVYFTGHLNPDSASIISAIAAASLFGGYAGRTGPVNTESLWLLKKFSLSEPELLQNGQDKKFFLLDFNQQTQAPDFITPEKIVGILDHHALRASAFKLNLPVDIDIRPWGSTCTILAYMFHEYQKPLSKNLAGGLLGGILSDTMKLRSPTTTDYDRNAVKFLAKKAGIRDTDAMAMEMFRARSDLSGKSVRQILKLDFKEYRLGQKRAGFGVAETVHPGSLMKMKKELIAEMEKYRKEEGLHLIFFAIVDSLNFKSYLLVPHGDEGSLAAGAFGGTVKDGVIDLGARVSRKRQIVPPLQSLIQKESPQASVGTRG